MNKQEHPMPASIPSPSEALSKLQKTLSEIQSEAIRMKERYGDEDFFADELFMVGELERSALSWKFIIKAISTVDVDDHPKLTHL